MFFDCGPDSKEGLIMAVLDVRCGGSESPGWSYDREGNWTCRECNEESE
tara:strand:- start:319 stop:465 length:147 start_codon:yes stop_codon:yes gene_type:complete